ncbi:tRNA (adenosine(37)-N6)-dimethylallyltransferase MiaA [Erythrobacter sp.]|uniref:tRNA (adenosine(37)-N6)-dimethylallyltransferase MiaA n=1 Tax=Erythrobacter sp. TaxID=1042 RepID=UPI001425E228|nr:tRNA (adenosine(37)-N6)-dimethylallyltransferase MiaA [Erythrobacter sp.]QIQ86199.1 MAG: tRNA (adenosine(37)-N6)-dimethylallyltransferase MiaA [Erythrobacter sp.]
MSTRQSPEKSFEGDVATRPLALIAGPTASGKSALALRLADRWKGEARIINADSMQVYRDIPILSAAPGEEERSRAPHLLYGEWDGAEACSAAAWAQAAKEVIETAHADGALPILVGGTGMYIKVLLEGIAPIPAIDPEIRAVVRALPVESAYAALMMEDPERAIELAPTDSQRIARALEVKRSTGVTLADWQRAKTGGIGEEMDLHAAVLMPEREGLYARCDARFEAMLEAGAVGEVEALLERGLDPSLPVMRAIGVPEIAAYLAGETSREAMIAEGQQSTRNYAKRQYTWLRHQSGTGWQTIPESGESENISTVNIFASLLRD